jgi:hypothetical protein
LHAIEGRVYQDRNSNGSFDDGEGVEGVVMRLQNGTATMTDSKGMYAFYDLAPGSYAVEIDSDRLQAKLRVEQPGAVRLDLGDDGQSKTGVDFRVSEKQKPLVMQKITGDKR